MVIYKLFNGIKSDYHAYVKHSESWIKAIIKMHFYCNVIFRLSHFFYQIKIRPLARILWLVNRIIFSIDIDPGAQLRGGFVILHGIGVVIGRYVISSGSFKIYQGATLGGNNGKEDHFNGILLKQPFISDGVIIGINATVLGPVVLEEGAIIGANAVVTKNVSKNSIVVGNNRILK